MKYYITSLLALTGATQTTTALHLRSSIARSLQVDPNTGRGEATQPATYSYEMSTQPWKNFTLGGGRLRPLDPTSITDTTMGFAQLELFPGGVREVHWHPYSAEWGYVYAGSCRFNLMDNAGRYDNVVANPDDIWYFPKGWSHSIQGVDPEEGCKMVLFFDAPQTPVYNDLSISEMINAFPPDVVSESLGVPESMLDELADEIILVKQGPFPPPDDFPESKNRLLDWPAFTMSNGEYHQDDKGSYMYEVRKEQFPATLTMSGGKIHLEEGSIRQIHWHPNASEMHYVLNGKIRVTVYGVGGITDTYEISSGDLGFVPLNFGHYIQAVDGPADILLTFNDPSWQNQELSSLMDVTPSYLMAASLNTTIEVVEKYLPKEGGGEDTVFLEDGSGTSDGSDNETSSPKNGGDY